MKNLLTASIFLMFFLLLIYGSTKKVLQNKDLSMIDHASIAVKNFNTSVKFYDETFKILGYNRVMTLEIPVSNEARTVQLAAWGTSTNVGIASIEFEITSEGRFQDEKIGNAAGLHFAFKAPNVGAVNAWYKKCLELGGKDNGKPGPRPEYHPGYYGAFVIDPSGWRIEAVIHDYKEDLR